MFLCVCGLRTKPSLMATSASSKLFPHPDSDEIPNVGCPGNNDNEEEKEKDDEKEHTLSSYYVPSSVLIIIIIMMA